MPLRNRFDSILKIPVRILSATYLRNLYLNLTLLLLALGGLFFTLRTLPLIFEFIRDMEELCPDAWLINFTNPMVRICDAVNRYSRIKVVGLCHQILVGYALVGMTLADELGIRLPAGITGSHATPAEIQASAQTFLRRFAKQSETWTSASFSPTSKMRSELVPGSRVKATAIRSWAT